MSSLPAFALMLATTQALTGKTWAGERVLMSPHEAVDVTAPTLAVYAGVGEGGAAGFDLSAADETVTLRIEIFTPKGYVANAGGQAYTLDGPGGVDLVLAAIWQQCQAALLADLGPWGRMWRNLALRITRHSFASDLYETDTTLIALRVHELTVSLVAAPRLGAPPEHVWADFLDTMRASGDELAAVASLLEVSIAAPADLAAWQGEAARAGVPPEHFGGVGLGPADATSLDEPPIAVEGALEDQTSGETFTLADGALAGYETPPA